MHRAARQAENRDPLVMEVFAIIALLFLAGLTALAYENREEGE